MLPHRYAAALGVVLALSLLAGCSDKDIERTLGKQTAAAIESAYRPVDDPLVADYINTMGHILVGHSRRQDIPYDFKVIETDVVNAAAVPWGYVYLTTGLLDFVESEDELWAITGHEIGHQVGRDSVKAVKENILLSLAAVLIGRETSLGGDIADFGFDLLQLKHSREAEYEADDHGTEVTYAAGYDPEAQVEFFERLMEEVEKNHPSRLETLFLTHPPSKARIERQSAQPEVALTTPDALTHVGAGYARRARYAEAIEKLSAAVALDGNSMEARLLLADCYLAEGERDAAAEQYAAAVGLDPSSLSAQEGLRAAQAVPVPSGEGSASPDDIAALNREVDGVREGAEAAAEAIHAARATLAKELKPASEATQRSTDTLMAVGQRPLQLPEPAQQLAFEAGIAVAHASECVYAIERVGEVGEEAAASLKRSLAAASRLPDHDLTAAQIEVVRRSTREMHACAVELGGIAEDMPALVKTARNAGRVSQTAALRVSDALLPGSSLTERQIAVDSVKLSGQRGLSAREEAKAAGKRAELARTRSLAAEINLGALALGPARARALDDLVAYYTQSDPQTAREVREANGLGHGETAVLLAAAKSSQRPVDSLTGSAGDDHDLVDAAEASGAHLAYVNLFLKFIADALANQAALS